ncbi:MAG: prepilin-type N-terminal cleavage/methylation domain-containing protein [Phycisphaerales bacterium]|jgi:prepilin-type N-terminal cleavage/methylation domain-containing protein|nr:prepilin-type N-terminal cleavage/methylation domain-containing protein [Phycisphaerales bacterium]
MKRRGFTMIELLLSLAITAVVAAGVAAMLGGLATGIALGSDARTGLLATAATHGRLVEELSDTACVLTIDDGDAVLWKGDLTPGGLVEPSELRWITFDPEYGELTRSSIRFPEDWSTIDRLAFDRPITRSSQLSSEWNRAESRGILEHEILADGLLRARSNAVSPFIEAAEFRIDLTFDLATGPVEATAIINTHGDQPSEWNP